MIQCQTNGGRTDPTRARSSFTSTISPAEAPAICRTPCRESRASPAYGRPRPPARPQRLRRRPSASSMVKAALHGPHPAHRASRAMLPRPRVRMLCRPMLLLILQLLTEPNRIFRCCCCFRRRRRRRRRRTLRLTPTSRPVLNSACFEPLRTNTGGNRWVCAATAASGPTAHSAASPPPPLPPPAILSSLSLFSLEGLWLPTHPACSRAA